MPKYATKVAYEVPYSIANKGPIPRIEKEEGLPPGGLDIAWVEDSRKNDHHWSRGLPWHDRLHAHATMNSARRNVKCKRPFEPKDELDFVLDAAYCPTLGVFFEKTDPYIHIETVLGKDMNLGVPKEVLERLTGKKSRGEGPPVVLKESWRVLRNRIAIYPDKIQKRGFEVLMSNGGVERRGNIYNVKLNIAADHTPQTNPGFSRTPCGAFYSI